MFKIGIFDISQLKTPKKLKNVWGDDKTVSITLYDKVMSEPNSDELAERILLLFTDERRAYKRTYKDRFQEFDSITLEYAVNSFPSNLPLQLHDVAVSDGRTALDLFIKISTLFPKIQYVASDYDPKVFILEKGPFKIVLSSSGKVLEIVWPPFVLNRARPRHDLLYPINYLVRVFAQLFKVRPMIKAYQDRKITARELLLFAPSVLKKSQKDLRLILTQHNLLMPFQQKNHLIRAMNILNPSYFSQQEFQEILGFIHESLLEKSFFVTGSNQEAGTTVNGGIYRKTPKGFENIYTSGAGSPVHSLISCYRSSQPHFS